MDLNIRFRGRKLNRREQFAVIGAGCIILLFIIIQLVISPVIRKKSNMERNLQAKKMILNEMMALKTEYDGIKKQKNEAATHLAGREKGFTLFSFLDRLAGEAGVKENISYMKPSTAQQSEGPYKKSTVEMKLQGISMEQLTKYLYSVETSGSMVFVKRLSISSKGTKDRSLTAVMQVETFEL